MSRKLIITGGGAGLVGLVVCVSLAWASSGREPTDATVASHGHTLRFVVPPPRPQDQKSIDVAPHGLSLGDEFVGAVSLKRHGHLVGRGLSECTINDATFKGQQCTLDLVLQRGVITAKIAGLDRPLPHQTPSRTTSSPSPAAPDHTPEPTGRSQSFTAPPQTRSSFGSRTEAARRTARTRGASSSMNHGRPGARPRDQPLRRSRGRGRASMVVCSIVAVTSLSSVAPT